MDIQQIQFMAVSSIQWAQYNNLLYPIIQKTFTSYSSLSGMLQFEKDIYILLNLVEMLANNLVNTVLSGSFNSYPLMVTAYLQLNLQ